MELGKISATRPGDPASVTQEPRWVHFKPLLFLKDVVRARHSTGNLSKNKIKLYETEELDDVQDHFNLTEDLERNEESNDLEDGEISNRSLGEECGAIPKAENVANEDPLNILNVSHTIKRKAMTSTFDETVVNIKKKPKFLESAFSNCQLDSEDMLFLRSLLPHMAKIPDHKKLKFRSRLQDVVEEFAYPQTESSL